MLLSTTTFVYVAVDIRPDVPQTLFGVVSAFHFARMLRTGAARDAVLSGFFGAIAFLFLQKAVLLLALYPVPFLLFAARRQLPWRFGLYLVGAFAAACVPFVAFLLATGSFDEYLVTNWLINAHVGAGRAPVSFLSPIVLRDFARNGVFWGLSLVMAVTVIRRRLTCRYALPAWFGLGLVALFFSMNRVVDRYLVAAVPFLAVAVGLWLADEIERRRVRGPQVRGSAALDLPAARGGHGRDRCFASNRGQLAQIQFVLDRSKRRRPDVRRLARLQPVPARHALLLVHDQAGRAPLQQLHRRPASPTTTCAGSSPRQAAVRVGSRRATGRCGLAGQYRPTPFDRPDGTRPRVIRNGGGAYFAAGAGSAGTTGGRSLLMIWYSNLHCPPSFRRIQITLPRSCRSGAVRRA